MIPRTRLRHCLPAKESLAATIDRFGLLWSYPTLGQIASTRFSSRLSSVWARVNLDTGAITLAASLKRDPEHLEQVLCHELAHIVAHVLIGRSEGPHGPTWRRLVSEAGYAPMVRLPETDGIQTSPHNQRHSPVRRFLHRCLVCDFSRFARRPMKEWRCADCVAAGLDGRLFITAPRSAE